MTLHIGTIGKGESRYDLTCEVLVGQTERQKELGHYRYLKESAKNRIRQRDNYTCRLCGEPNSKVVDHIVPWRISQDNSDSNLRVLCAKCNLATRLKRRDARLPLNEWYNQLSEAIIGRKFIH